MDATAGVTASKKAFETLKSMPPWLLGGVSVSLFAIWLWSPFLALLLPDAQQMIPVVLFVAATLTIFRLAASAASHVLERRRGSAERDRQKLVGLYRPLASLFLTRHVTICTGTAAPHLRHRFENVWIELRAYRRRTVGVKRAWRALFDRQSSSSAGIEFGGVFPLDDITRLVRKHAEHADNELFRLINRADRSRYEEAGTDLLTSAEYALFEYIESEHTRLSRKYD